MPELIGLLILGVGGLTACEAQATGNLPVGLIASVELFLGGMVLAYATGLL